VLNRGLSGYNTAYARAILDGLSTRKGQLAEPVLATVFFGANDAAGPENFQAVPLEVSSPFPRTPPVPRRASRPHYQAFFPFPDPAFARTQRSDLPPCRHAALPPHATRARSPTPRTCAPSSPASATPRPVRPPLPLEPRISPPPPALRPSGLPPRLPPSWPSLDAPMADACIRLGRTGP
jgi:hypothetical protein